jgi:DNA mismatch endonuclease (patch repair protein)
LKIKVPRFTTKEGFSTTAKYSAIMSRIRSTQTEPELIFRKKLWSKGIRYRINSKRLPGKPDIVINKMKVVIFIDGEFWHGYNWDVRKTKLKTNVGYWIPKIERNMQRDRENNQALKNSGYTVIRFWEHQIRKDLENCVNQVIKLISKK